jgi:hypothetical protein
LLAERDEMKKLYRGPYIDAFCQVWFHLAWLFQRRLKCEKVNGRTKSDGNTSKIHIYNKFKSKPTNFSVIFYDLLIYSSMTIQKTSIVVLLLAEKLF